MVIIFKAIVVIYLMRKLCKFLGLDSVMENLND